MKKNKNHEINFVARYDEKQGKMSRFEKLQQYRMLIVVLVIMVGLSGVSLGYMFIEKNKMESLREQITDKAFVKEYTETQALENKSTKLSSQCNELDTLIATLATYPKASSAVVDKLNSLATSGVSISISSYDATSGAFSFVATSSDNGQINIFIQMLDDSSLFSDVSYSGYSYQTTVANYSIHVQCTLAADAGRG